MANHSDDSSSNNRSSNNRSNHGNNNSNDSNNDKHHNEAYQKGLQVRTKVMGEAHVKTSLASVTPFTEPLQDWIIEHAWGSTWQEDEILPHKYRSLITLAFLIAQKSPDELKGHVKGAIHNGASVAEIREVLLHSLPYCGAPTTQTAFRATIEAFAELGIDLHDT